MKRQKLMTAGVILALSIFSSASYLAAGNDKGSTASNAQGVIYYLFGPKDSVDRLNKAEGAAEEKARQARLWDEHYGNNQPQANQPQAPTAADLAEQKREAELKRQADLASEEKKKELAAKGFWKEPVMASDQGDKATQNFIDTLFGDNGAGGAITNAAKAAVSDVRDHAKEAAKDAASDARDGVRSATTDGIKDNCKNSMPMGH